MKQFLKAYLIHVLSLVKAFPTTMTDPEDLRSLLKSLYPVSSDKELIRLGPKGDGGYLVPDDLTGIQACFSPGVCTVSGFEKDCAERGMKVFLADKSIDQPAENHELFNFSKMFIGALSNDDFMTLDDWVGTSLSEEESDLLLQIDIEGYEYEVLLSTSDALMQRFRVIVAEFHELDQLWNKPFFNLVNRVFQKILQTHLCVHIHPNNAWVAVKKSGMEIPRAMEFTFVRRDCIGPGEYQKNFPHPLDYDNTNKPTLPLPSCWYNRSSK